MQIELENKLKSVKAEIIAIANGKHESEVLIAGGDDFKDGYLHALFQMGEWLEGMIANCD